MKVKINTAVVAPEEAAKYSETGILKNITESQTEGILSFECLFRETQTGKLVFIDFNHEELVFLKDKPGEYSISLIVDTVLNKMMIDIQLAEPHAFVAVCLNQTIKTLDEIYEREKERGTKSSELAKLVSAKFQLDKIACFYEEHAYKAVKEAKETENPSIQNLKVDKE